VPGHFIPKGTIVIPNVWHLNRDPEIHGDDAVHFNPARYLDGGCVPGAASSADGKDDEHVSYGFGRRVCPGRHLANNSLFIDIAMMLWAAKIERYVDADGTLAPLDVEGCIDDGIVA
jgi:cytochrome P450